MQAIEMMGIGKTAFYNEVNKGNIILKKYGRKSLVTSDQIENWIASLPTTQNIGGGDAR